MGNPKTLEYAPKAHHRSRVKIILHILLLGLMLMTAGAICNDRVDLWLRVRRLYWYHECVIHVTPPGTVLVEYDPVKAAKLLATNPDYVADRTQWSYSSAAYSFQKSVSRSAVYWPSDWRHYLAVERMRLPQMIQPPNAIAFLGERTSPCGHHRLVVIPVSHANGLTIIEDLRRLTIVLKPPTLFGSATTRSSHPYNFSGAYEPANLSPGVADPADASHLSIDFMMPFDGNYRGTVHIYLRDDDTLNFQIRSPAIVNAVQPNQN